MKKPLLASLAAVAILTSCGSTPAAPTITPAPTLSQELEQAKQDLQGKTGIIFPTLVPTGTAQATASATIAPVQEQEILLKDPSGGAASAIARSSRSANQYNLMILADLPELTRGKIYYAWLIKGEDTDANKQVVIVGALQASKAGFSLDYTSHTDLSDHLRLLITNSTIGNKQTPGAVVVSGTFK